MREFALTWYTALGALNGALGGPLRALSESINLPALTALIFGVIGATAPCQLTTNVGALAYVARRATARRAAAASTLAYVAGKVVVYSLVGAIVIAAGREIVPVQGIVVVRRLLGPVMLWLGLYFLGVLPFRLGFGQRVAGWLEDRAGGGATGAFVLGVAFSFAFCPTLFLLFFVFTIPLALTSPAGVLYPGLFALGTAVPLLAFAAAVTAGVGALQRATAETRRLSGWLRRAAGIVLFLAGINDTITYWLL